MNKIYLKDLSNILKNCYFGLDLNYENNPPLLRITKLSDFSLCDLEKKLIFIKAGRRKGEIFPRFPLEIDEKLGSIVGHILGDGSIDKKHSQVFFSNSNIELLEEFRKNMKHIFGIEPRIWMQEKSTFEGKTKWDRRIKNLDEMIKGRNVGLFYPKVAGLILNHIFNNFAIGKKKKITKYILNANLNFKKGLLRAFFDDEGSISASSYTVRVFQDNKEILKAIKKLLLDFGIKSNPIRFYIKRNKKRHYFNITRKENHLKFYNLIGFTSSNKRRKLQKMLKININL